MELRITTSAGMVTLQPVGRTQRVYVEGRSCLAEQGQGHSMQQRHTQDCDGWCEAPIPEKGLTVDLGIGIVRVGVTRRSFDPGPAPNCAVPAHNGIEDTGVILA